MDRINRTKARLMAGELALGMGLRQARTVGDRRVPPHGKHPGMGGVYDPQLMPKYVGMGMRFILAGNDLAFLMAAAKERAAMLRNVAL